jgi:hypothetical protein
MSAHTPVPATLPPAHPCASRPPHAACTALGRPPAAAHTGDAARCRRAPDARHCRKEISSVPDQGAPEELAAAQPRCCRGPCPHTALRAPKLLALRQTRHPPDPRLEPVVPIVGRHVMPVGSRPPELGVRVKVEGHAAQQQGLAGGRVGGVGGRGGGVSAPFTRQPGWSTAAPCMQGAIRWSPNAMARGDTYTLSLCAPCAASAAGCW